MKVDVGHSITKTSHHILNAILKKNKTTLKNLFERDLLRETINFRMFYVLNIIRAHCLFWEN